MSTVTRSLDLLFPPFREQVEKFIELIKGTPFEIYETYRSFQTQMEYYQRGRKIVNGLWVVENSKEVVTKAKPGMSFHAYGLAFDCILDGSLQKQGIQWSWSDYYIDSNGKKVKADWKRIGTLGKSIGLEWAGDWKTFQELPHFQNTYGFKVSEMYPILMTKGLGEVWLKIEEKIPKSTNKTIVVSDILPVETKNPIPVNNVKELDFILETNYKEKEYKPNFLNNLKIKLFNNF